MWKGHRGVPILPGHCPDPSGPFRSGGCCLGTRSPGLPLSRGPYPCGGGGCRLSPCPPAWGCQQVGARAVHLAGQCYRKNETHSKIWEPGGLRGTCLLAGQFLVVPRGHSGARSP